MSVGELIERKDRPAYVCFVRVPVEDKPASLAAGHFVAKDVDFAHVTPPYSKDIWKVKVSEWFPQLARDVQGERIPQAWVDGYKLQYQAWKNGQELPLNGTAIRGWGVISPAQQETLIKMNILTVEDLAAINDEGIKRVGMGAGELKVKATAWLAQLQDKGPLTLKMAALETENELLKSSVAGMSATMDEMKNQIAALTRSGPVLVQPAGISAAEILEEDPEPAPKKKVGRPSNAELAARG